MIGILDSGIGGLRVVRKIIDRFPDRDIFYFGDTARRNLGDRSPDTIIRSALQSTQILLAKGARQIVITSHTISGLAGPVIRDAFNLPVLDAITPTVELAVASTQRFCIGIMTSRAIAGRNIYRDEILKVKPDAKVYSIASPLLVPLVEEGWLKRPETVRIVKKYVSPLKTRKVDTLILGGSHYILLKRIIQRKIGKKIVIIDANDAIPAALSAFLGKNGASERAVAKAGEHQFQVSDLNENLLNAARRIYGRNIELDVFQQG